MAVTKEVKAQQDEIAEVLARVRPICREAADLAARIQAFLPKVKQLDVDVVQLSNAQDSLEKRTREGEAELAKAKQEAKTQLQSVHQGHQALIEKLTRDRVELEKKIADTEKAQRIANEQIQKYTLLNEQKEQQLKALTAVKK